MLFLPAVFGNSQGSVFLCLVFDSPIHLFTYLSSPRSTKNQKIKCEKVKEKNTYKQMQSEKKERSKNDFAHHKHS